jgi:hypothetical protein
MTRERIHCGLTAPVLKVGILAVLPRPRAAPTKFDQPWTTVRASAPRRAKPVACRHRDAVRSW